MNELIFETVHGSGLYGLAHAGSDHDVFRVTTSRAHRSRHFKSGDEDVCEVGIGLFLERAQSGSHQSVEALFSPYKAWQRPEYQAVVETMRVTGSEVFSKYERTIKKFAFGDFKRRRHAVRLSLNLFALRRVGKFNPVMGHHEIAYANALAEAYEGEQLLTELKGITE